MARHNAVQRAIGRILRSLAPFGIGTLEHPVHVPEWDTPTERAILDLRIEGGPGGPRRFADVVVPHPVATHHQGPAAARDGAAAAHCEREKYRRYGPHVLPLAVESFGRWGPAAMKWWRALAQQVARADPALQHQGKWAVPGLLNRWWAETGAALQRANAEALLASTGLEGLPSGAAAGGGGAAFELLLPGLADDA